MLIANESVLNDVHKIKASERVVLLLEAIVSLIKMIDISYLRLVSFLQNLPNLASEEVILEAWTIVDNLNRLRCVLGKGSGVKKNSPWFQLISRQIKIVESSRNFIEHYDRSLELLLANVKPVLGHLSWIEPEDEKTFLSKVSIPGKMRLFKGLGIVNPAGKKIRDRIDQITLYLDDNELNLSDLYYDLRDFAEKLEDFVSEKYTFN